MSNKIKITAEEAKIPLIRAMAEYGLTAIGEACGLKYQSVSRWRLNKRLPFDEHMPGKNYALKISKLTRGKYTVKQLRDLSHLLLEKE